MKLTQLLPYDNIVVQCHNNPDADAIASGYGVYTYFQEQGKNVRLVYGGPLKIQKVNLVLMTEHLDIPIEHVPDWESYVGEHGEPELLLVVDGQHQEGNVQEFSGKSIAVIDHHRARAEKKDIPDLWEIRDNYGSCATVVWDMLCEAGFYEEKKIAKRQPVLDERLSTALYYGLFMDTGRLQEMRHPKDRDMRDAFEFKCNQNDLFLFQNNNLSLEELEIAGQALAGYDYHEDFRFAVAEAKQCDPNILGVISDMMIEVSAVDICVVYCMRENGVKLSVRSCVKETRANELAGYLFCGGGHPQKAGGFMKNSRILSEHEEKYGPLEPLQMADGVHRILIGRMKEYFKNQVFIHAGTEDVPDLSAEPRYQKKRLPIGYVRGTDLYPAGTKVTARMLEGDISFVIKEDTYIMIGVESEVYKNDEAYFLAHNDATDKPYKCTGEYAPTIHESVTALGRERKSLEKYAKTCIPKDSSFIRAREITCRTKVFVSWSDNYMLGEPGDYLAAREENPKDIYIIKKDIFKKTYERG